MNKNYENEARERWGETDAYREYQAKKSYVEQKYDIVEADMAEIFSDFFRCKQNGASPDCDEARALVKRLQAHIIENYYTCTDEILKGLGKFYVSDERFIKNIDKSGEGTAKFVSDAIENYFKG